MRHIATQSFPFYLTPTEASQCGHPPPRTELVATFQPDRSVRPALLPGPRPAPARSALSPRSPPAQHLPLGIAHVRQVHTGRRAEHRHPRAAHLASGTAVGYTDTDGIPCYGTDPDNLFYKGDHLSC